MFFHNTMRTRCELFVVILLFLLFIIVIDCKPCEKKTCSGVSHECGGTKGFKFLNKIYKNILLK